MMEGVAQGKISVQLEEMEFPETEVNKDGIGANLPTFQDAQAGSSTNSEMCSKGKDASITTAVPREEATRDESENTKDALFDHSPKDDDNHIKQELPSLVAKNSENADSGLEDEVGERTLKTTTQQTANEVHNIADEYLPNIPCELDTQSPSTEHCADVERINTTDANDITEIGDTAKSIAEATAIVESSISSSVSSPATTSVTSGIPTSTTASSIYHVKWVGASHIEKSIKDNMLDATDCSNSNQGGKIAVVTQNENGPCPLLSIVNVLLLQRKLKLPDGCEVISAEQLLEYIG